MVPAGAPRDRRPTDTTMLVLSSITFLVFALRSRSPIGALESAIVSVAESLPPLLDPLWRIGHDAIAVWALVLLVTALLRRQFRLVASMGAAVAVVYIVGSVTGRLVNGEWPDLVLGPFKLHVGELYPALSFSIWVAVTSVASAYLSRPYRFFGRMLVTVGAISSVALGSNTPGSTVGRGRPRPARRVHHPPRARVAGRHSLVEQHPERARQHGRRRHSHRHHPTQRCGARARRPAPTAATSR